MGREPDEVERRTRSPDGGQRLYECLDTRRALGRMGQAPAGSALVTRPHGSDPKAD